MHIIDRRLNPKGKSLGNRQRFVRRAQAGIREAVREALKSRKVSEVQSSGQISIHSKGIREPSFVYGRGSGQREFVLPGNKHYSVGDTIPKPDGQGQGQGAVGSSDGGGQDDFVFSLTKDEFLDVFFEDLELPDLIKTKLKDESAPRPTRAGFTIYGSPGNLNRLRTMRNSLARRISLRRPKPEHIRRLEEELEAVGDEGDEERAEALRQEVKRLSHRMKTVAFIDPLDLRYNRFERLPRPTTQAVMFCLMDASASMTEDLKELAKRFFMLLHVFLSRQYRSVDLVFIRHTTVACEVDEDTFFRSQETGGTVVSTALEEMHRIVRDRFPVDQWNIYAAQASDGENFSDDIPRCISLLEQRVLPVCQYVAYIEVSRGNNGLNTVATGVDSLLWSGYRTIAERCPHFAMRRVSAPSEIFPIFHDLFARQGRAA